MTKWVWGNEQANSCLLVFWYFFLNNSPKVLQIQSKSGSTVPHLWLISFMTTCTASSIMVSYSQKGTSHPVIHLRPGELWSHAHAAKTLRFIARRYSEEGHFVSTKGRFENGGHSSVLVDRWLGAAVLQTRMGSRVEQEGRGMTRGGGDGGGWSVGRLPWGLGRRRKQRHSLGILSLCFPSFLAHLPLFVDLSLHSTHLLLVVLMLPPSPLLLSRKLNLKQRCSGALLLPETAHGALRFLPQPRRQRPTFTYFTTVIVFIIAGASVNAGGVAKPLELCWGAAKSPSH